MQRITRLLITCLIMTALNFGVRAQQVINTSIGSQHCQGDEKTVTFSVSSPFTTGNQFRVELSQPGGTFPGTFIENTPLTAFNVGNYSINITIPLTTPQGAYCIRVVATNPIYNGDPVCNLIIGALPPTDITIFGAHYINNTARFCLGDSVWLRGPQPPPGETYTYQWYESGVPILGATNDSLFVSNTGMYKIEVTSGLCSAESPDTVLNEYVPHVSVGAVPATTADQITLRGPDTIQMCIGNTVRLFGPNPVIPNQTFTYNWYVDSISGTQVFKKLVAPDTIEVLIDSTVLIYLRVTDDIGGCISDFYPFWVFVDTIPNTSIQPRTWPWQITPTLDLCLQDSVLLSAVDTIFHPDYTYQWQIEDPLGSGNWVNLPGAEDPWFVVDTNVFNDTASYRLVISNFTCEHITNSLQVNFVPPPTFSIFPSDTIEICEGDSALVLLQGTANQYRWDGGVFIGSSRWMTDPGTYVIRGVGTNNCSTFDTLHVIFNVVNADAGPDQTIAPGQTIQLSGSGGVSYYWFSETPVYFNNHYSQTPLSRSDRDTTVYIVRVTDENGCDAYDTMRVFVEYTGYENVMNLITPNGDGRNDVLDLRELTRNDNCEIVILDRWGKQVFSEAPYQNGWGGTKQGGDPLPDGTYYILLQCNNEMRYKGAVTVLRNEP